VKPAYSVHDPSPEDLEVTLTYRWAWIGDLDRAGLASVQDSASSGVRQRSAGWPSRATCS